MAPLLLVTEGMGMTEEQFLEIGETPARIEFLDGSLLVTPAPSSTHQYLVGELLLALHDPAKRVGLRALANVNVRCQPHRIPIPDLVVTSETAHKVVLDAGTIRLACEVLSPHNETTDKVLKSHYYAEAGIPWYLMVEQETATLHLHRLSGQNYAEHSVTAVGDVLELTEPVVATLDPAELLPPG